LLSLAADQDREVSHRRRIELAETLLDHGERITEGLEATRRCPELVAVLVVVALEPPGADAEDEPASAQVVDRACHVGEELRVPVGVAGDEHAEARPARLAGHRGEQRPAFEVRPVRLAEQRVEVVPRPDRVDPELVRLPPGGTEFLDRAVLRAELDADAERAHAGVLLSVRWWASRKENSRMSAFRVGVQLLQWFREG